LEIDVETRVSSRIAVRQRGGEEHRADDRGVRPRSCLTEPLHVRGACRGGEMDTYGLYGIAAPRAERGAGANGAEGSAHVGRRRAGRLLRRRRILRTRGGGDRRERVRHAAGRGPKGSTVEGRGRVTDGFHATLSADEAYGFEPYVARPGG